MSVLGDLRDRAAARPAHIVMSEGADPRIVAGSVAAVKQGIARVTLVGDTDEIQAALVAAGMPNSPALTVEDPARSARTEALAAALFDLRKHKGMTEEQAARQARDPLMAASPALVAAYHEVMAEEGL